MISQFRPPSVAYGSGLMAACLLVTLVAFNHDKDNGWLVVVTAGAVVALSLLGPEMFSGAAGIHLATAAGAVGTLTLMYVVALAIL